MASLTVCMAIATAMPDIDRDALLERVDAYIATGMPPGDAQRMAANDIATELDTEHDELQSLAQAQHPTTPPPAPAQPPAAPPAPVQEPIQFARDDAEAPKRRRQDSTRATVAAGRIRRSVAELADLAASMELWRDWYELHQDALVEQFGARDAELFLRLLSITSQASDVRSNFTLALKAYRQWYAMAPFTGYLPSVATNLQRLREGEDIRGPKITQYGQAVLGYEGGIAVDRHLAMLMFNVKKPNKRQREAALDRVEEVAKRLGWTPREVQSALWAYNQYRLGTAPEEVATYASLAEQHRARIAATVSAAKDAIRQEGGIRAWRAAAARTVGLRANQASLFGRAGETAALSRAEPNEPIQFSKTNPNPNTMAALEALPDGYKVKWDKAAGQFHVWAPSGKKIHGTGAKKLADSVAAYLSPKTATPKAKPPKVDAVVKDLPGGFKVVKYGNGFIVMDELGAYEYDTEGATLEESEALHAYFEAAPSSPATPAAADKSVLKGALKSLPTPAFDQVKAIIGKAGIAHTFWLSDKWVDGLSDEQIKIVADALAEANKLKAAGPTISAIKKELDDLLGNPVSPSVAKAFASSRPQWAAPDTPEFRQFFGKSKVVTDHGEPMVMLHGTAQVFSIFTPKQAGALFVTKAPSFAQSFVKSSINWMQNQKFHDDAQPDPTPNIMPVWVRAENPYNFNNDAHVDAVFAKGNELRVAAGLSAHGSHFRKSLAGGHWTYIEEADSYSGSKRFFFVEAVKALGFDGFYMTEGGERNIAVFDSSQLKSALGPTMSPDDAASFNFPSPPSRLENVGSYGARPVTAAEANALGMTAAEANALQAQGDIRFSRDPEDEVTGDNTDPTDALQYAVPAGGFTLREFGRWGKFIEAIQDRYNRWKEVIAAVRAQGGVVTEANDFYKAEERYWGKVGARIEDFRKDVKAWVEAVTKDGFTLQDVAMYAYAQHAKERNDYIASKRPGMPDGGSGMSNAVAAAILADAQLLGYEAKLQAHAATLRQWIQGTRDIALDEGLITDAQWTEYTGMFQFYVPLRGLEKFAERMGTGQGMTGKGTFSKEAKGRYSEAKNQIEQVVQDRVRTLIRAGKNEVVRTLGQFMLDNPDPTLWEFSKTERKPVYVTDANGNTFLKEKDVLITDDRTIVLMDGGEPVYITIKDDALLKQMQNLNAEQVGKITGAALMVNRLMGKLYTSLSPVFTVINAARDVQAATIGIIDTLGFTAVPKLYAKLPAALAAAWMSEVRGKPSTDYQLYRSTGGKTGFFDFKTIDDQADELKAYVESMDRSSLDPRAWAELAGKAMHVVENVNAAVENAARFASFQAARESGKSVAEAASIAKNITVNFNRKGTMTPTLSAFFLFFNPAVQGTTRMLQALQSPKVLASLGAGMTGILMLALMNGGMGDDDDGVAWWDKIPSETKERNLIFLLPPGAQGGEPVPGTREARYVKIPMPYGYNFFAVVANQLADAWRHSQDPKRGRPPTEGIAQAFKAFMGSWVPVPELGRAFDNPKSLALTATPDALNPIMQGVLNLNAFGRTMRPDDAQSESKPASERYFAGQAGTMFQKAAEGLNALGGGNKFTGAEGVRGLFGLLDQSPATLETLARGYGGGIASFILDTMNAVYMRQSIARPEVDVARLPFAKQLYGVINDETDRMVSTERIDKVKAKAGPMKAAVDAGDAAAFEAMAAKWGKGMYGMGEAIQDTREVMGVIRDAELQVIDSKAPDSVKYLKLMELNKTRRKALQAFNAAYDRVLNAPQVSAAGAP